jgi:hypothetical protein
MRRTDLGLRRARRVAAMLAMVFVSAPGAAQAAGRPVLGVDIGISRVLDNRGVNGSWGAGFAGRLGYRIDLGLARLTPEVGVGYAAPGAPEYVRVTGGARLGFFDFFVSPVVFGHAGAAAGDLSGFAWDAGGGLDARFGDLVLGLYAALERVEDQDLSFTGADAGASEPWESIQIAAMFTLPL